MEPLKTVQASTLPLPQWSQTSRYSFLSLHILICHLAELSLEPWYVFKNEKPGKPFQTVFFNHLLPKSFSAWTVFLSPTSYVMMMTSRYDSFDRLAYHKLLKLKGKCGTCSPTVVSEITTVELIIAAGVLCGTGALVCGV